MSTTTSAQPAQLTRNERLDRLPFNKAHRKLLVASGIGWAFDAMDVGLVSFVVAAIAADPHFNLTPTEKSWVLSIGFVGMAIGAAVGGFIADRVGRKTVFTATLIIFGIANGAMALSWSLGMLLGARLIIGLGLGAELPVASTLVSEFSPTKQRGRMTVLLESFWAVGWIVGRKTVFTATLIIFGSPTAPWRCRDLHAAPATDHRAGAWARAVASTLVSEFSPTKQRGRMTVLLESFWAVAGSSPP